MADYSPPLEPLIAAKAASRWRIPAERHVTHLELRDAMTIFALELGR